MRYLIYFRNSRTKEILEDDYQQLIMHLKEMHENDWFLSSKGLVNLNEVTDIEEVMENATGQVIMPKTPQQIQEQRDRDFAKATMNPNAVISKARGDEETNLPQS